MLTSEEVKKVALLARIELGDDEVEKYRLELSTVLDYVEELKQVNTEGVTEVSQVTGLENVQRMDVIVQKADPKDILSQAPDTKNGYFKVKAIF